MSPELIRAARQFLGMSQEDFARLAGVRRAYTVSRWETGKQQVALRHQVKIVRAVARAERRRQG